MNDIVLVVVAHPDDECIAMAGTIRRHVDNGDCVYVISMTNGVSARGDASEELLAERKAASDLASITLGFEWARHYNFADNAMDSHPLLDIVRAVEEVKNIYQPTMVYTHSCADLNIDHRVVANAVLIAFRPQPHERCKELRLFEVASATDYGHPAITGAFRPNLFINITNHWEKKLAALQVYSSELRDAPGSRSLEGIKNLSKLRGSQVGFEMAEAFEVIRKLEQ